MKVELLGWIVQSGGEVAGALIGLTDHQLVYAIWKGSRRSGWCFAMRPMGRSSIPLTPSSANFSGIFLGTKPESVHESVRAMLAPSLEARPKRLPSDPAILDQYELLIEQTLLAGRVQEAFDLYWYGLGAYGNLGWVLGEYGRGLRILERFVPGDDFSIIGPASLGNDRNPGSST